MSMVNGATAKISMEQCDAQDLANQYLADTVGSAYRAVRGFYGNDCWYFLIHYFDNQSPDNHSQDQENQSGSAGEVGTGQKLVINSPSNKVVPLTDEQIRDLRESPFVNMAKERGELARGEDGYVLRYQARRAATMYLFNNVSMHFSAAAGLLIPVAEPIWQFPIRFRLPSIGTLEPLGLIDVDAQSGEVKPLPSSQINQIRMRIDAIIEHRELATAA